MDIINTIGKSIKALAGKVSQMGDARYSIAGERNYLGVQVLGPNRLAKAFKNADQGDITEQAELFNIIEVCDTHIYSEMAKRRRGVTCLSWRLEPPPNASGAEIKATEELSGLIRSIDGLEDALYDLTDAIGKGFSALEIGWRTGKVWVPKSLTYVPQSAFGIDIKTGKMGLRNKESREIEALRDIGWIIHEHKALSGYLESAALFRVLSWCYIYKSYDTRDMQRFLEVYGLPLRLGKYPAGTSDKDKRTLLSAVRNLGSDAAAIVPETMMIEFIQSMGGKVDDFLKAIGYWDERISTAVLGGTLTSGTGTTNTNALGQIHEKSRLQIVSHDVRQIEPTLRDQLLMPIAAVNGLFNRDRLPQWRFDQEEEIDREAVVKTFQAGVQLGMQIPLDYAHQELRIPKAGKDQKVLGFSDKKPEGKNSEKDATTRFTALKADGHDNIAGEIAKQLADEAGKIEDETLESLYQKIAAAGSLEDALNAIENVKIERLNARKLADKMAEAGSVAWLAGREKI